jgi:hypothetical protein
MATSIQPSIVGYERLRELLAERQEAFEAMKVYVEVKQPVPETLIARYHNARRAVDAEFGGQPPKEVEKIRKGKKKPAYTVVWSLRGNL